MDLDLNSPVTNLPLVGPSYARKLEKLNIHSVEDLLHHIPSKYKDFRKVSEIRHVRAGETVTIEGKIVSIKNVFTKRGKNMQLAQVEDASGSIQVIWFNQVYLVRNIDENSLYAFSGKVDFFNRKIAMISPDYEKIGNENERLHTGRLIAVYPETAGLSSKWLRGKIRFAKQKLNGEIKEFLPEDVLAGENFPEYERSIEQVHFPENPEDAEIAKRRLAFNELLFHHLESLLKKDKWSKNKVSFRINADKKTLEEFKKLFKYELTDSQLRSITEIIEDLKKENPMNRLLEGDVGSGKTVIAAFTAYASFVNGYQSILMAPTQILAKQHYDTFRNIFDKLNLRISLLTSAEENISIGQSDIFIGTHSLIYKKFEKTGNLGFKKVAAVIIDEQHRFGVEQREILLKKAKSGRNIPNLLTMTATPIPRSVALTLYGELDLSVLTELPGGRQPITTWIVPGNKKVKALDWISEKIKKENVQAFYICPLIEESVSESMKQVKAAKEEYQKLKDYLPEMKIGLLHGKQKVSEKNKILDEFREGKINILVATPVVEVGIDVPNATIMVIESGERYGLAQLHQLRGRIGRGTKKSYCLIFTDMDNEKTTGRLQAMTKPLTGFELSELDLKLRGPGEIFGNMQHGFPELKVANWSDAELIIKTRKFAEKVIEHPDEYTILLEKINSKIV